MTRRTLLFVLTIVVVLTAVLSPFQRELFVGDETKYSQVVREMRDGSMLVPTLNGEPYTHKPPLHFWVITAFSFVFGLQSVWPFVLQSLIGFLVLLWLVHRFARELVGDEAAAFAPFIFATFYLAWGIAQTARMDNTFVALITLSVYLIRRHLQTSASRPLYAAGIAVGVAILIKGPMAFVIPAVLVLFEKIRRKRLSGRAGVWIALVLIAAAIPLVWLVPALIAGGSGYAEELLGKQTVGRAVGNWVHAKPLWFYVTNFPVAFFPWFFVVAVAAVALYRRAVDGERREALGFCVSWFLSVFVPFSLLSGKLHVYMLPALLPAAIVTAWFLAEPVRDRFTRIATVGNVVVLGLVAVIFSIALPVAPRFMKPAPENVLLHDASVRALFYVTAGAAIVALIAVAWKRGDRLVRSSLLVAGVALVPLVYVATVLVPVANDLASAAPLVAFIERQGVGPEEIAMYHAPHLWSRAMKPETIRVRHIGAAGLDPKYGPPPRILIARSSRVKDLGVALQQYEKVGGLRMIGKDFDVYRRR